MKYIWQNFKCFWIAAMHGEVHNVHSREEIWREYAPILIVQKIQKISKEVKREQYRFVFKFLVIQRRIYIYIYFNLRTSFYTQVMASKRVCNLPHCRQSKWGGLLKCNLIKFPIY